MRNAQSINTNDSAVSNASSARRSEMESGSEDDSTEYSEDEIIIEFRSEVEDESSEEEDEAQVSCVVNRYGRSLGNWKTRYTCEGKKDRLRSQSERAKTIYSGLFWYIQKDY